MTDEINIIYTTVVNSSTYIYDEDSFITVLDGRNLDLKTALKDPTQITHRVHSPCKSKKDFEIEVVYLQSTILNKVDVFE